MFLLYIENKDEFLYMCIFLADIRELGLFMHSNSAVE